MPASVQMLHVDANVIGQLDAQDPWDLFFMWKAFTKSAPSVVQGRRLENLSWRVLNRETFCCNTPEPAHLIAPAATTLAKDIPRPTQDLASEDVPLLSGSVDSVADEEAVDFTSVSDPVDIVRPRVRRQDSCASNRSRGKERHLSPDYLEKMVVSIIEANEPLLAPITNPSATVPTPESKQPPPPPPPELERSGSTSTESSLQSECKTSDSPSMESLHPDPARDADMSKSHTTVIRGFSPTISIIRPSVMQQLQKTSSPSAIPDPEDAPPPKIVVPKKQQPKFALGGSGSSADDSFVEPAPKMELRKQLVPQPKKKMFQVGGSSEEDCSLKSALHSSKSPSQLTTQKKTQSFSKQLVTRTIEPSSVHPDRAHSGVEFGDDVNESAIDDEEDESLWEEEEGSTKSSDDEQISFKRVDSRANLTSRPSLITLALARDGARNRLGNGASQSMSALSRSRPTLHGPSMVASPNDSSDDAPLMMKRSARAPPMRPINEMPRSTAQPILTPANGAHHQAALSPRTTRRNMLATELTESLRRQLLWERSQKSSVANAVLKRRHTSHDVANLREYPEKPFMKKENDGNSSSWNQYFDKDGFTGYHAQGW